MVRQNRSVLQCQDSGRDDRTDKQTSRRTDGHEFRKTISIKRGVVCKTPHAFSQKVTDRLFSCCDSALTHFLTRLDRLTIERPKGGVSNVNWVFSGHFWSPLLTSNKVGRECPENRQMWNSSEENSKKGSLVELSLLRTPHKADFGGGSGGEKCPIDARTRLLVH